MALPVTADAKAVLRIQGTTEDTLVAALITRATAMVRGALGRPITIESRTFTDYANTRRSYHTPTALIIPAQYLPCVRADDSSLSAPVITDVDGTVLSATDDYYVGAPWDTLLRARPGVTFANGPYTIDVDCGLEASEDYLAVIEPSLSVAILDVVADLYQRRNPNAQAEGAGGGVYTQWAALQGLPPRVWEQIRQWAVVRAVVA